IEVDARLPPRVQPTRDVEPEEAIEERHAGTHAAQRPTDLAHLRAIADPADVAENARTHARIVRSDLEARHPEGVTALRGIGTLPANRLRAAEIPQPLRGDAADRTAAGNGERAGETPAEPVRRGEIQRAAAVERIAIGNLQSQVA